MTDRDKPSVILRAAADRISPPGAWTQGAVARNFMHGKGRKVLARGRSARCWCLIGAIQREAPDLECMAYFGAVGAIREAISTYAIATWNDAPDRTQTEVVEALRRAADIAEERGE